MDKVVVYTGQRPFYEDMVTAIKSLLYNTKVDRIYLMIEDDEFPHSMPSFVKAVNAEKFEFFSKNSPNYNNPWSHMILNRVAFSKIFPEEDVILSMDVDAIVDRDISPIWDYPIEKYYVAGVPEVKKSKNGNVYINYGVALLNLKKIRESGIDDRMIQHLNTNRQFAIDQDTVNKFCKGSILAIPSEYNSNDFTEKCEEPRVVHFAGRGEYFTWGKGSWRDEPVVVKYREMPWWIVTQGNK